jgi:hypothetical protein
MPEADPGAALLILAVAGAIALLGRAFRTGLRLALQTAEATAASGLAEVSARRGDVTGLAERRVHLERARRLRRTELLFLGLWVGWLAIPPLAGWLPAAYAPAVLLWLLPRRPIRPPLPPTRTG